MGELFDEGYLTQERLEWAAQWAYNPKQKIAAKILLETGKSLVPIPIEQAAETKEPSDNKIAMGITLEKARSTPWPFSPFKGQPMGLLVDSKQLSTKDLGFAIDTAWDERVRQAAIALMLTRLDRALKEPIPSAGSAKVVTGGRSYAERRETIFTLLQGIVLGFSLSIVMVLSIYAIKGFANPNPNSISFSELIAKPFGLVSLIVALVLMVVVIWLMNYIPDQFMNRTDKKIQEYRFGQEGEDNVLQSVSQALDGNWHVFRNVRLYGRHKGDLDLVLVGPPGIWVLEVKNFNGEYRNIGDGWELRKGKTWKKALVNPSRQANNNSLNLKNFLKAENINTYVNPIVVWANPESPLTVENPMVAVWQFTQLSDELGNIWQGEKLSQTERDKIIEKLTKLCERRKEELSK